MSKTPIRKSGERKGVYSFRLDARLVDGLRAVYERDGILPSEQLRRLVEAWLEKKGIELPDSESQPTARKRRRR